MVTERIRPNGNGGTVTVALKHPCGILARVFKMVEASEPRPDGGRNSIMRAEQIGEAVRLNGYLIPGANPQPPPSFALTHNVSAEFMSVWFKQNADSDLVAAGLIIAHEKQDTITGASKERAKTRTGLEPLIPPAPLAPGERPRPAEDIRIRSLAGNRALAVGSDKG